MLPEMNILGLSLHSYEAFAALAAGLGLLLCWRGLKGLHLGLWRWLLPMLLAVVALAGARLWNCAVNPSQFGPAFPLWSLRYGRLSLYGGLLAAFLALLLFCRLKKASPLPMMDAMVLPGGAGLILLKLGCFLNGCCFGKATNGPLGFVFPANGSAYDFLDALPFLSPLTRSVYPTQLFEALGAALCLLIVFPIARRRKWPPGAPALLYAFCFTLVRLIIHPLRVFPYDIWITTVLYPAMYAAILVICAVALIRISGSQQERSRFTGR